MNINALYDRRSEPDARAVLADQLQAQGIYPGRLGIELPGADAGADAGAIADADASADADAIADADADAGVIAGADAGAIADASAGDGAIAGADASAGAGAIAGADASADADAVVVVGVVALSACLFTEPQMEHGLMLVMIRGAYGYTLTLCGWAYRIRGDEWVLAPGNRTVFRTGAANMGGFDELASKGPRSKYRTSEPAEIKEPLHRLLIFRAKPANVEAWRELIPRPSNWSEAP